MKMEDKAKYLGDWLSSFGRADSVSATVMKRKGLAWLLLMIAGALCVGVWRLGWIFGRWRSCQCSSIAFHAG